MQEKWNLERSISYSFDAKNSIAAVSDSNGHVTHCSNVQCLEFSYWNGSNIFLIYTSHSLIISSTSGVWTHLVDLYQLTPAIRVNSILSN